MNRETIIKKMRDIDLIDFRDEDEDEHVAELVNKVASIVAISVAKERDECAKVCESRYMGDNNREDMEARQCAAAIRARGEAV